VGISLNAQGLEPESMLLTKEEMKKMPPSMRLNTDIKVDTCMSEFAADFTAPPVGWSVNTPKERLDKKAVYQWHKKFHLHLLDENDAADQHVSIDEVDCLIHTDIDEKPLHEIACFGHKDGHYVLLGLTHKDKAKLPSAKTVKQLLDKMLARL
jgi:hypothetical protein